MSSSTSTAAPIDLRERLDVLFYQEATSYKTEDYLRIAEAAAAKAAVDEDGQTQKGETMTSYWREVICEWAYNCKFGKND